MQKIVIFDKKLLTKYTKNQINIIKEEKIDIKDLSDTFNKETELLENLEAKIPPSSKVKIKMFSKKIFNQWIPFVFALLSQNSEFA